MHHRLTVNGLSFNVLDEGAGEPVLLIHGFPDDHTVWRNQAPALVAAGYRVIAPDTRGIGQSDMARRTGDYALPNLVSDIAGILDQLEISKVKLVGHDWGAVIGWHFCFAHPGRVERYAALSVGHPTAYARGPAEQKLKGLYVLLFQVRWLPEWLLSRHDWKLFRKFTNFPAEAGHWIARLNAPGRLTSGINYYRANLGLVSPHQRPKPAMPVLGMFSDGDAYLAEAQMRDTAKHVSGPFRFEVVHGANHWLQLDAPDQVNRLLIEFLGEGTKS
jgi:pimeloyl-ACP methyl ester carboxylesterase